jgi:hypothetical protein
MKRLLLVLGAACAAPRPPAASSPPVVTPAAEAKPVIPDTPAGRTLIAFLEAFDSGNEAHIADFVARYKFPEPEELVPYSAQTDGLELVAIEKSQPLFVTFLVKEMNSARQAVGWLRVKEGDPAVIDMFTLLAIPPGVTAAEVLGDVAPATPTHLVDAIATQLNEIYVYPELAKKMEKSIREHLAHGDYDAITTGPELAARFTEHLRDVSHDRHLAVEYAAKAPPEGQDEPSDDDKARMKDQLERIHCGFDKPESLDGNIGYLKFDMFGPVDICGPKATEAFSALGDVDALILDLRHNGGGQPKMVAFVASYLFGKRTHLNDIYARKDNKTDQFWTEPDLPGKKFATQPVFVLTSAQTFSGGEEFCYDLQNTKRATIVGEVTGGGAHPTMGKRLDDHFVINVPFARAINPVTKTDWEGKGIQPDVKVPADQALETAKKLAVDKLKHKRK